MSSNRDFMLRRGLRGSLVLGALLAAVALTPPASAKLKIGVNFNIALPAGVHVNVGNYEPYYVGRVFYEPHRVWRTVYSFPVQTPHGIEYVPYVYENGQVVCHDYIPGPGLGYGQFIIEGRGHYNPQWRHGRSVNARTRAHGRDHDGWNDRQAQRHDGDWDRDRNSNRDHDRERSRGSRRG